MKRDEGSEKDEAFLQELVKQELAFCNRVNKYHPRNYYLWNYRHRLVLDLLKPLNRAQMLGDEVGFIEQYLKTHPTDSSAKHYLKSVLMVDAEVIK